METPHSSFANQDRSVYSEKLLGVQRVFEALDCLSRYMVAACGMDHDIFVGRLYPEDLICRHKDDTVLAFDCQPGEPLTRLRFSSWSSGLYAQASSCAIQRDHQPFFVKRLAQIIDRVYFECLVSELTVPSDENEKRRTFDRDLLQHLKSVQPWHLNIQEYEIGRELLDHVQAF